MCSLGELWGDIEFSLPSGEVIALNAPQTSELWALLQASKTVGAAPGTSDAASSEDTQTASQSPVPLSETISIELNTVDGI